MEMGCFFFQKWSSENIRNWEFRKKGFLNTHFRHYIGFDTNTLMNMIFFWFHRSYDYLTLMNKYYVEIPWVTFPRLEISFFRNSKNGLKIGGMEIVWPLTYTLWHSKEDIYFHNHDSWPKSIFKFTWYAYILILINMVICTT